MLPFELPSPENIMKPFLRKILSMGYSGRQSMQFDSKL